MSIAAVAPAVVPPFAGAHPVFFPFFVLIPVFWALVVALVVVLVVRSRRRWWAAGGPGRSAEQTLAERFAKGDIEEQEYRARLEVLRANRIPSR